jgi:MarR family transcriptional regulator, transcriptional regulator for hemolysin
MALSHPPLPCDAVSDTFPRILAEAARGWRSKMDARLRPLGLSNAMWTVMAHLAATCPLTQRKLAQAVGVEGSTLVRLLDRLEQGGFARRVCDPGNRRVKRVELTEKATPLFAELRRTEDQVYLELLRDIPPADLAAALKVLLAIRDRL